MILRELINQIDDIHLNTTTYSGMMDTAMSFRGPTADAGMNDKIAGNTLRIAFQP